MALSKITDPLFKEYVCLSCPATVSSKQFGNYDTWRAQWVAPLKGLNLMGYVDGSRPCPKESPYGYRWDRQE
ncbi:hypothetical protein CCACVL1_03953 [Corchorus capsularis]|uniref:Uncharacterized protein n=1 Tax=Corchorus capsularis TaxID=210143 RepID=A0A1R3JW10_COCAP|nr:hypothetical protein CCACVL1_03953 [Corchorus capsularis]